MAGQRRQARKQAGLHRLEEEQRDPGDEHAVEEHSGGVGPQFVAGHDVQRHRPHVEDERLTDAGDEQESESGSELSVRRGRPRMHQGPARAGGGCRRYHEGEGDGQAVCAHRGPSGHGQSHGQSHARGALRHEVPGVALKRCRPPRTPRTSCAAAKAARASTSATSSSGRWSSRPSSPNGQATSTPAATTTNSAAPNPGPAQHRGAAHSPAGPVGGGPGHFLLKRLEQAEAADVHQRPQHGQAPVSDVAEGVPGHHQVPVGGETVDHQAPGDRGGAEGQQAVEAKARSEVLQQVSDGAVLLFRSCSLRSRAARAAASLTLGLSPGDGAPGV